MLVPGHRHGKVLEAPIGFVFLSIADLGSGPFEAFGRTFYKADGSNGTTNLIDKFPRMTNSPGTTGGSDNHTLTENEMPPHNHGIRAGGSGTNWHLWYAAGGSDFYSGSCENTGGGAAHENRPAFIELIPYEAVS